MSAGPHRGHYAPGRRRRRTRVDPWGRKRAVRVIERAQEDEPDVVFMTADVVVYTAILGGSMLPMLLFGRAWAVVALVGLIGAWASPEIAARLSAGLRRWLGRS